MSSCYYRLQSAPQVCRVKAGGGGGGAGGGGGGGGAGGVTSPKISAANVQVASEYLLVQVGVFWYIYV